MTSGSQVLAAPASGRPPVQLRLDTSARTISPWPASRMNDISYLGIGLSPDMDKITLTLKSVPSTNFSSISVSWSNWKTARTRSSTCSSGSSFSLSSEDSSSTFSSISDSFLSSPVEEEEQQDSGRAKLLHHLISGPDPNCASRKIGALTRSDSASESALRLYEKNKTRPRSNTFSGATTSTPQQYKFKLNGRPERAQTFPTYRPGSQGAWTEQVYHPSPWGNDHRPRDVDVVQKAKTNVVNWMKNWGKTREMLEFEAKLKSWDEMKRREGGWY